MIEKVCTKPPTGWACTRADGHDGPCAAITEGDNYIAWLRYVRDGERTRIVVCDSDAIGAFKVYRKGDASFVISSDCPR